MANRALLARSHALRIVALSAIALISALVSATAAMAAPTVTYSPLPPAVVATDNVPISFTATDTTNLWNYAQLSVDGAYQSMVTSLSADRFRLTGSTTWKNLKDGPHGVRLWVIWGTGYATRTMWVFTVQAPPRVTPVAPAAGSVADTLTPTISAVVTDNNGTVATSTMTIDGTPVTTTYDASTRVLSHKVHAPLSANATHTVQVTSVDAAGNSQTKSWSFKTGTGPAMAADAVACTLCHATFPAAHPISTIGCYTCHAKAGTLHDYDPNGCGGCHTSHTSTYVAQRQCTSCHPEKTGSEHAVAKTPTHATTTANFASCQSCHDASLTREHAARRDGAGKAYTCETCHASTARADVKAAIAANNTACTACHNGGTGGGGTDPHGTIHEARDFSSSCSMGTGCHVSKVVSTEHERFLSRYPTYTTTCALCHQNTSPTRIDWTDPGSKNADCSRCHVVHADPAIAHKSNDWQNCSCHASQANVAIQHGNQCSLCHGPTARYTPTNHANCDSCHPPGH